MSEIWTTLRVLEWTTGRFVERGVESARLDAEVLLAHALGTSRVALYTGFDRPLGKDELAAYRELVKRRLAGEPVAYLVGAQEFWSIPVKVDPRVLIPRRDTETLVEVASRFAREHGRVRRVADVATGSGAVALALAKEIPGAIVIATDVSEGAVEVARENVARLDLAARVEVRPGDLVEPLRGDRFDLIVANPPYVSDDELDEVSPEVRREPRVALAGGPDGLAVIRRLVPAARPLLEPGAMLAIEHGWTQGGAVRALLSDAGYLDVATTKDLGGRERVTSATARME